MNMSKIQKWNNAKGEYEPYEVPADWQCRLSEPNMDEIVNCAACGKKTRFGECYTSLEIHDRWGFGYAVCPECYQKEIVRRLERARGEIK